MSVRNFRAAVVVAALVVTGGISTVSFAGEAKEAPRAASAAHGSAAHGKIAIIQAVPKLTLTVTVDGRQVQQGVAGVPDQGGHHEYAQFPGGRRGHRARRRRWNRHHQLR